MIDHDHDIDPGNGASLTSIRQVACAGTALIRGPAAAIQLYWTSTEARERPVKLLCLKISSIGIQRSIFLTLTSILLSASNASALQRVGVTDSTGKWVIPDVYRRIRYLGSGKFLCYKADGTYEVRNRDGTVDFEVSPPDGRQALENFYLHKEEKSFRENLPQHKLEGRYKVARYLFPDRYLAAADFGSEPSQGIVDKQGKTVFTIPDGCYVVHGPMNHVVVAPRRRKAYEDSNLDFYDKNGVLQRRISYYEIKTGCFQDGMAIIKGALKAGGSQREGVVSEDGIWLQPLQLAQFEIGGPERVIKSLYDDTFLRSEWDKKNSGRLDQFHNFLRKYNLIGMKHAELLKLLGQPDADAESAEGKQRLSYAVSGFRHFCASAHTIVQIELSNGRVLRWRFHSPGGDETPWITTSGAFDRSRQQFMQRPK